MMLPRRGLRKPGSRARIPGICAPLSALLTNRKSPVSSVWVMLPLAIWNASKKNVLMMRNNTSAMPRERIQLSNQRAKRERRRSGATSPPSAGFAPGPSTGAPKSCMRFTLQGWGARRNGHRPPPGRRPPPHPGPELLRQVAVAHAGGEAYGLTLAFQTDPGRPGVGQPVQGAAIERRAAHGEEDEEALEFHGATVARRASTTVIRYVRNGAFSRLTPLRVRRVAPARRVRLPTPAGARRPAPPRPATRRIAPQHPYPIRADPPRRRRACPTASSRPTTPTPPPRRRSPGPGHTRTRTDGAAGRRRHAGCQDRVAASGPTTAARRTSRWWPRRASPTLPVRTAARTTGSGRPPRPARVTRRPASSRRRSHPARRAAPARPLHRRAHRRGRAPADPRPVSDAATRSGKRRPAAGNRRRTPPAADRRPRPRRYTNGSGRLRPGCVGPRPVDPGSSPRRATGSPRRRAAPSRRPHSR